MLDSVHRYVVLRRSRHRQAARVTVRLTAEAFSAYRDAGGPRRKPTWTRPTVEDALAGMPPGMAFDLVEEPEVIGPVRWSVSLGVGTHLRTVGEYDDEETAHEAGIAAWRERVAGLDGAPAEPVVLRPRAGQSAWNAAEEYELLDRD